MCCISFSIPELTQLSQLAERSLIKSGTSVAQAAALYDDSYGFGTELEMGKADAAAFGPEAFDVGAGLPWHAGRVELGCP